MCDNPNTAYYAETAFAGFSVLKQRLGCGTKYLCSTAATGHAPVVASFFGTTDQLDTYSFSASMLAVKREVDVRLTSTVMAKVNFALEETVKAHRRN